MIFHCFSLFYGTIWDTEQKKWIPDNATLIGGFEVNNYRNYMVVSQSELDEINRIKEESEIEKNSKKYNL